MSSDQGEGSVSGNMTAEGKQLSIFETTARLLDPAHISLQVSSEKSPILDAVRELLTGLGTGNTALVEQSMMKLGATRENDLFHKVGNMARSLHNSLTEFKNSLDRDSVTMTTTTIPDAADKLEKVISMTHAAAEKTLSITERQANLLKEGRLDLKALREKLPHATEERLIPSIASYLDRHDSRLRELEKMNSEILMAQEFQDLTGQALRKVIKLVTELESNLVSLIQIFGGTSGQPAAEQPAQDETALQQDAVDSVLSSFGF